MALSLRYPQPAMIQAAQVRNAVSRAAGGLSVSAVFSRPRLALTATALIFACVAAVASSTRKPLEAEPELEPELPTPEPAAESIEPMLERNSVSVAPVIEEVVPTPAATAKEISMYADPGEIVGGLIVGGAVALVMAKVSLAKGAVALFLAA